MRVALQVRWNSCYAMANMLRNPLLFTGDTPWLVSTFLFAISGFHLLIAWWGVLSCGWGCLSHEWKCLSHVRECLSHWWGWPPGNCADGQPGSVSVPQVTVLSAQLGVCSPGDCADCQPSSVSVPQVTVLTVSPALCLSPR